MSDINRDKFPALSDKLWARMIEKKRSPDYIEDRHDEEVEKIQEKVKELTLLKNARMKDGNSDINVVLIGKTGVGKSATANTIFGEKKFKASGRSQSQTQNTTRETGTFNGRKFRVVDTPGLADTGRDDKYIKEEIAKFAELLPDGVHAFIYVMNMANARYTAEDKRVFQHVKDLFGNGFENYCILLFTRGENCLDEYCESEIEENSPLGEFLELLDWRVAAIDNSASSAFEQQMHRENLLKIISKVGREVSPPVYTNKAFQKAQNLFKKYQENAQKENWDPALMDLVEEIIGLDPDISRKDLEKEVQIKIAERAREEARVAKEKNKKLHEDFERKEKERDKNMMKEIKRRDDELKARTDAMDFQLKQELEAERRRSEDAAMRQLKEFEKKQEEMQEDERRHAKEIMQQEAKRIREESEAREAELRRQAEEEKRVLEVQKEEAERKQRQEAKKAKEEKKAAEEQREEQEEKQRNEREKERKRHAKEIALARRNIFQKAWDWITE